MYSASYLEVISEFNIAKYSNFVFSFGNIDLMHFVVDAISVIECVHWSV